MKITDDEKLMNIKRSLITGESVRSEAVFALAKYLNSLKDVDKHQLFDLVPSMGGFHAYIRESEGKGEYFTHAKILEISREGIITELERTKLS